MKNNTLILILFAALAACSQEPWGLYVREEGEAPIHGEVFVAAYRYTLARMASQECSDAL